MSKKRKEISNNPRKISNVIQLSTVGKFLLRTFAKFQARPTTYPAHHKDERKTEDSNEQNDRPHEQAHKVR